MKIADQLDNEATGFEDIFSDIFFIPIYLEDSSYLSSIDKLEIYEGQIFLLDKKLSKLVVCDLEGKQKMEIGKLGFGPGEFQGINDISIDDIKNEITLFSNADLSLYYFSIKTGIFLEKVKIGLHGYQIEKARENQYLLYLNNNTSDKSGDFNVLLIGENGKVIKKFFPFDLEKTNMIIPFSGFFRKTGGQTLFSPPFYNSIFQYDHDSMIFKKRFEMDINNEFIEENKENFQRIMDPRVLVSDLSTRFLGESFFNNSNFIIFNYHYKSQKRIGLFNIKSNVLKYFNRSFDDPIFALINNPLYMNNDYVYFGVSSDQVISLKEEKPDLYQALDSDTRKMFEDNMEHISYYLLKAKLKNT